MTNVNTLSKIKEPIRILRKFRNHHAFSAIIAGGYHRDLYNEVDFRDIDIYLKGNMGDLSVPFLTDFFELKVNDFRSMDRVKVLSETDEEYDVENSEHIVSVYEMVMNELHYNFIMVDCDPIKYVKERFDFGICKVYCDGTKITYTEEFMADAINKTLTFSTNRFSKAGFHHAMHVHLSKLKQKYPGHTLVIPEKHQKNYKEYIKYTR